ncbi:hypothetical protein KY317_00675, partial [Candidatus Woesearchaeota archaeon]|nr:hypothetical protein [Candidatus Woesearchaeota archaeon]
GIPVYIIAGSHDFSPSGKTMLDVLEKAGLFVNVAKGEAVEERLKLNFTVDSKTGAKITGMIGKKGGLEKEFYRDLIRENLEQEEGYKIFMFHSALDEFKPEDLKEMEGHPVSFLPKGFDYYAGGHVHYIFQRKEPGYGLIAFPGPCFPNNFKELEKLGRGGFYIADVSDGKTTIGYEPVQIHNVFTMNIDAGHKTPEDVEKEILSHIENKQLNNTIITMRVSGKLSLGRPGDVDFKRIFEKIYGKSAYFVMKNTSKLICEEFEEIKVEKESPEEIENSLIKEHVGKISVSDFDTAKEEKITKELISALDTEKQEGERISDFEQRIKDDAGKIIGL